MKKSILFFVVFIGIAGVMSLGGREIGHEEARTSNAVLSASLVVEDSPRESYAVLVPQGSSVYDLMKYAEEQGFQFKGRNFSGMGFFVDEISGKAQSHKEGMYWIYSINAKKAEVGVSNYIIQPNDVISWSYEKSY